MKNGRISPTPEDQAIFERSLDRVFRDFRAAQAKRVFEGRGRLNSRALLNVLKSFARDYMHFAPGAEQ